MGKFFNDKLVEGLKTGIYICPECGEPMIFEDEEICDILVCENCGFSEELEHYGFTEEQYAALYPTKEELED